MNKLRTGGIVSVALAGVMLAIGASERKKVMSASSPSGRVLDAFPVGGHPNFGPTFGAPRPGNRGHQGVDIFAPEGTPVYAVTAGYVRHASNNLGGTVANLTGLDGTWYYYAHLSGYEGEERQVQSGEVIGYVGHTGNAAQTPPHLHFEIHPDGGAAIDPFPALREAAPDGSVTRA